VLPAKSPPPRLYHRLLIRGRARFPSQRTAGGGIGSRPGCGAASPETQSGRAWCGPGGDRRGYFGAETPGRKKPVHRRQKHKPGNQAHQTLQEVHRKAVKPRLKGTEKKYFSVPLCLCGESLIRSAGTRSDRGWRPAQQDRFRTPAPQTNSPRMTAQSN
jgi:hypothetical protein